MPKQKRPGKLLDVLLMRDDELVPVFYSALMETDQRHVVRELGYEGMYTFASHLSRCLVKLVKCLCVCLSGVNISKALRLRDRRADVDETWQVYSMGLGHNF